MFTKTSLLSYIQTYSGIFRSYSDISSHIVAYLEPCVTLAYSEPCRIQNPGIFSTWDTCRTLPKYILAYSERRVTLAYSEPCRIQNPGIFSTWDTCRTMPKYILAYSERRVTLAYSELCRIKKGPEAYSEPCQTSNMEGLTKLVKTYNYSFSKVPF